MFGNIGKVKRFVSDGDLTKISFDEFMRVKNAQNLSAIEPENSEEWVSITPYSEIKLGSFEKTSYSSGYSEYRWIERDKKVGEKNE